jgi:hypothetical protein
MKEETYENKDSGEQCKAEDYATISPDFAELLG